MVGTPLQRLDQSDRLFEGFDDGSITPGSERRLHVDGVTIAKTPLRDGFKLVLEVQQNIAFAWIDALCAQINDFACFQIFGGDLHVDTDQPRTAATKAVD